MQIRREAEIMRFDPAEAISAAYLRGLAALNRLACKRINKTTRPIYQSIRSQWSIAKLKWYDSVKEKSYDFSVITRAEPNIRKMYLRLLFESTVKYGNKVFHRVYDNLGDNDPLNGLLNNAGSMMRDFSGKYYPFPRPVKMGNKQGYMHKKFGMILIGHANIPSLDFIDMIRAHVIELCKHLFIYKVPIKDARKYILRLLYGMAPYLDWVYAGGKRGKNSKSNPDKKIDRRFNNFTDMDKVLGNIISEIEDRVVISSIITKDDSMSDNREKTVKHMQSISPRSLSQVVNTNFFNNTYDLLIDRKKRTGTIMHKQILAGIPQPYQLRDVIFSHSSYLPRVRSDNITSLSKYLVVAELPLLGGRKRADIVVFTQYHSNRGLIWRPVMVLDIKIKQVFDWTIRKNPDNSMPQSVISPRDFDEDEWGDFISQAMNNEVRNQLDTYASILEKSYRRYEPSFNHKIITGVLAVDHRIKDTRKMHSLIYSAVHQIEKKQEEINGIIDAKVFYKDGDKILIQYPVIELPHPNNIRSAIVLDSNKIDTEIFNTGYTLATRQKIVTGNADLKLFISVASDINYGNIAAWISGHSNLIDLLRKKYNGDIYIYDIHGMLSRFTRERLRIKDLGRLIITDKISEIKGSCPVIISGWSELRQMGGRAFDIKNEILGSLWFQDVYLMDTARKDERTSRIYRMRRVFPYSKFYPEKPSEIIWDLPLRPKKSRAPTYDNLRVIIREKLSKYCAYMVEVDGLKHIARHFSQNRGARSHKSVGSSIRLSRLRGRDRAMKIKSKKNSPKRKKTRIKSFKTDAHDLLAHYDNKDKNLIELHDIIINGTSRTKYNYGIRYIRGRYRDITKEFKSRRGYQPKYKLPNSSRIGPDPRDFEFSSEFTNLNNYVSNHIIDHHWNRKIQEFAIALINYSLSDTDNNIYNELEVKHKIIQLTLDDKWSFYINHAGKITFSEFKQHSLWLDLLVLTMKLLHPHLVDYQLRYLWRYFSSWLLLSAGYSYSGISRFNIREIIQQLNRIAGGYDKTPQHVDKHRGYIVEIRDHTYFYFDDEFKGFVYKLRFNRYLKIKYDVHLRSKLDKYEKIRVKITRYGEDEYLWKYHAEWEIYARIRYNPHSYIKLSTTLQQDRSDEVIEPSEVIEIETEDKPSEYEVVITLKLVEDEICMEFSDEDLNPRSYHDLSELLSDLNTREIEMEQDDRWVTIRWGQYDVKWGDLGVIRAIFYKDERCKINSPDDIETIVDYLTMEGETVNCKLKHNNDNCMINERDYWEVPTSEDERREGFWRHFSCWELECEDIDIKNKLRLYYQSGLYGYDVSYLYNTGFIVKDDYRHDLKISLDEDDETIYQEDLGTLWVLRGIRDDLKIKLIPVLSHKKPDTYTVEDIDVVNDVLEFELYSNRNESHPKVKRRIKSYGSQCKKFDYINHVLSEIDDSLDDYKLEKTGLDEKISLLLKECEDHFTSCGCEDPEGERIYAYGGIENTDTADGTTIEMALPILGSVIGEVPQLSYTWDGLFSEVVEWLEKIKENAKDAVTIGELNKRNSASLLSLFGWDTDRIYMDTVDSSHYAELIRESIDSLLGKGYDTSELEELFDTYDILVERLEK